MPPTARAVTSSPSAVVLILRRQCVRERSRLCRRAPPRVSTTPSTTSADSGGSYDAVLNAVGGLKNPPSSEAVAKVLAPGGVYVSVDQEPHALRNPTSTSWPATLPRERPSRSSTAPTHWTHHRGARGRRSGTQARQRHPRRLVLTPRRGRPPAARQAVCSSRQTACGAHRGRRTDRECGAAVVPRADSLMRVPRDDPGDVTPVARRGRFDDDRSGGH